MKAKKIPFEVKNWGIMVKNMVLSKLVYAKIVLPIKKKSMNLIDTPEKIVHTFVEGWNEKDAIKLATIFVQNAEFVNVTGLWWHTKERIYKAHEYGLRVIFKDSPLKIVHLKTRMLSENIAMIHAKMRLSEQTPLGEVKHTAKRDNILLFICKRYEKDWLCEAVQNTEIVPGKETFIVNKKGERSAVDYGKYGKI